MRNFQIIVFQAPNFLHSHKSFEIWLQAYIMHSSDAISNILECDSSQDTLLQASAGMLN